MKPHGFTVWKALVFVCAFSVLAAICFPCVNRSRGNARRASCQSNLKQLALAFQQYTADYDKRWPPVAINPVASSLPPYPAPYGWADALYLYPSAREFRIYQCIADDAEMNANRDATRDDFIDYYFNANLSMLPQHEVESKRTTILQGEGRDGMARTDSRYARRSLPPHWTTNPANPVWRHLGGANYAFADGHVKWLKPMHIKPERRKWKASEYSFAVD